MAQGRVRVRRMSTGGQQLGSKIYLPTTYYVPRIEYVHSCTDHTHPGPPYKSGGPLTIKKETVKIGLTNSVYCNKTSTPKEGYAGRFRCAVPSANPSPTAISGYGAIGWNRTLPVRPVADLGTAIGELKDIPKMLTQTRDFFKGLGNMPFSKRGGDTLGTFKRRQGGTATNPGSDYLNLQFGWVPFVRDLLSVLNARENLDKKLSQLRRDNGKRVRRRMHLLSESSNGSSAGGSTWTSLIPVLASQLYSTGDSLTNRSYDWWAHQLDVWYSARYRYWIPSGMLDPRRKTAFLGLTSLERRLLGIELNAHVIYNLIPWSWLLDWFTNVGPVIQNAILNSQYHVVADYAYVMGRETYTYWRLGTCKVRTGTWGATSSSQPERVSALSSRTFEFKSREVAHPYGFGITDSSLSGYQWSILAALGISRL